MASPTLRQVQDAQAWLQCVAESNGAYTRCPLPVYDCEMVVLSLLGFYNGPILAYGAVHDASVSAALRSARAHWSRHLHSGYAYTAPSASYYLALDSDLQNAMTGQAMQFAGYTRIALGTPPTVVDPSGGAAAEAVQTAIAYYQAIKTPKQAASMDFYAAAHRNGAWVVYLTHTVPVNSGDPVPFQWGSFVVPDNAPTTVRSHAISTDYTQLKSGANLTADFNDQVVMAHAPPVHTGTSSGSTPNSTPYTPSGSSGSGMPSTQGTNPIATPTGGDNGQNGTPPVHQESPPAAGGIGGKIGIAAALAAAAFALSR